MAINVRPLEVVGKKWEQNSMNGASNYVEGSENPRRPWEVEALKAEKNYKVEVVKAANEGRFGRGVKKAGNAKQLAGVIKKGRQNYETGISGSSEVWQDGFKPYQEAIKNLDLPDRSAKNSLENYNRSRMTGQAQAAVKARLQGRS